MIESKEEVGFMEFMDGDVKIFGLLWGKVELLLGSIVVISVIIFASMILDKDTPPDVAYYENPNAIDNKTLSMGEFNVYYTAWEAERQSLDTVIEIQQQQIESMGSMIVLLEELARAQRLLIDELEGKH